MLVLRVELMRRIGLSGTSTGQRLHQKSSLSDTLSKGFHAKNTPGWRIIIVQL